MFASALTGVALAGAAVGSLYYQSMWPTARWFGTTFTGMQRGAKQIALTYDDGPNDPYTLRLLEILSRHQVNATFFLIGRYVQRRTDIAREIAKAGHIIGNHTFTHPPLIFQSQAEIRKQLSDCHAALSDAVGEHSRLFRPPFGGRRPAVLRIARELGLQPVMWTVSGSDWNALSAATIERKVSRRVRGGDVILLHDGGHKEMGADRSQTVEATDHLLRRYDNEGYKLVTVPEMMGASNFRPSAAGKFPSVRV